MVVEALAHLRTTRQEELAFYAARTLLHEIGDGEKRTLVLLDIAARRFERSKAVWLTRALLMRKTGRLDEMHRCYLRALDCSEGKSGTLVNAAFERFSLHVKDTGLSLRGEVATLLCSGLVKAQRFSEVLPLVADALTAAEATPTDRVSLLAQRAEALGALEQPLAAAEALEEALAIHARERVAAYFPKELYYAKMACLLAAAGLLDEAVRVFAELLQEAPKAARELWERDPRMSGEPRFAVLLSGLQAAATPEVIEAGLARAEKLLRRGRADEARGETTAAVAGAFLHGDSELLSRALVIHADTLGGPWALPGVHRPPLERALTLTRDRELRKRIEGLL